ncbi:nucleotidyltransferase domain-containing protein [Sporosarcina sp. NPDC096371]|uniref:nucleotidyltransferase domain-containing protein n=1 Tax=Sporosarcina sp. NPDC096371 TaxID=3364530 RepID=UPI0038006797
MFSTCSKVNEWMLGFGGKWGIAGGWAIDLYIGKETRLHSDIEVALFREDQRVLKKALPDWSFEKIVKGELISWDEEWMELPVHEIHGIHKQAGERLEVLLNEARDGMWIFRRESSISFPESSLFLVSNEGVPYLHPAVVLLYKAKNAREKDHADFNAVKNLLKAEDKEWLCHALRVHVPEHKWIREL